MTVVDIRDRVHLVVQVCIQLLNFGNYVYGKYMQGIWQC